MSPMRMTELPVVKGRASNGDPGAIIARTRKLVPERIRVERARRRLSQRQVAEACYVSQRLVCEWEAGRTVPKSIDIVLLAEFFDCSADYLLGRQLDP